MASKTDRPQLRTFSQFAQANPAFSVSTLRWLRYRSTYPASNLYGPAFVKVAGRVLIDERKFFEIVWRENGNEAG